MAQISHSAAFSGLSGGGSWRCDAPGRMHAMSPQRRRPSSRGFVPVEPARRPVLFINPTSGAARRNEPDSPGSGENEASSP
jgi:hypothetical protein